MEALNHLAINDIIEGNGDIFIRGAAIPHLLVPLLNGHEVRIGLDGGVVEEFEAVDKAGKIVDTEVFLYIRIHLSHGKHSSHLGSSSKHVSFLEDEPLIDIREVIKNCLSSCRYLHCEM